MTPNYTRALHLLRHYINCIEVRTGLSNGTWWKLTPGIYADLCDENPPYVVVECRTNHNIEMLKEEWAIELPVGWLSHINKLLKQTEQ